MAAKKKRAKRARASKGTERRKRAERHGKATIAKEYRAAKLKYKLLGRELRRAKGRPPLKLGRKKDRATG